MGPREADHRLVQRLAGTVFIDRSDHVAAGLEALAGAITERTAFLIAHHMEAHAWRDGEGRDVLAKLLRKRNAA